MTLFCDPDLTDFSIRLSSELFKVFQNSAFTKKYQFERFVRFPGLVFRPKMSERRRKFGRFFEQNSRLPEKLFIRRQNIKEFDSDDDDDLEVIVIDGKAAEDYFCFVLMAINLKVNVSAPLRNRNPGQVCY